MSAFLRLTPGMAMNSQGLLLLRLGLWKGSKEIDHLTAVSGQPGRQTLLRASQRWPGTMQPIGEGVYDLGDPDGVRRVNWASGVGRYQGSFGPGLGPVWVGIHPPVGNTLGIKSFDFGIHADDNEASSPGTSGCVGIQGERGQGDYGRLKQLVSWFAAEDVARLVVDWGLGTVSKP